MPRINKQSLREEFDQLKVKFEDLSNEGKITPESSALFQAMIMLFEPLIAVFMEKKTRKNSRNASIPSSQTGKDKTATTSGTNSKGKKPNGILPANTRTVETTQVAKVTDCQFCGEALDGTPAAGHERGTKINVIFEKVISHVNAEIKVCPRCKTQNKGRFPEGVQNLQKRYRNIMTRGEKELPPIPPKQNGKRGKVAKSDAHNLWERLKTQETAVLLFAKISHVPFTNNRAERDLRMSKVNRKYRAASGQKNSPRPTAVYPAICRPWQIRDTIRWSPSKWPFLVRSTLIGASSY